MHTGYIQFPPRIVWDAVKARANLVKHGVDFADAVLVLEDARALTIDDPDHDELRFRTLGADPSGRLLVVVYAMGLGDAIRLISARRASPRERIAYDERRQTRGKRDHEE